MTGEEREVYRQAAVTLAHEYGEKEPDTFEKLTKAATEQVKTLRTLFPGESDESLARAARLACMVIRQTAHVPLYMVDDVLDSSLATYTFACASLAGVYDLPGTKPEVVTVPDARPAPGQYL